MWFLLCQKSGSLKNLYPAILLANGQSLGLLSAMVSRVHEGLRVFCQYFMGAEGKSVGQMLYAYLMAWFAIHYEG